MVEIIHHLQDRVKAFVKFGKRGLDSYMVRILHFWLHLTLIKSEYGRWSQILSGWHKELTMFPASLTMNRIDEFHLRSCLNLSANWRSMQKSSLRLLTFIVTGKNSWSAWRWGNVTNFVLVVLKVTSQFLYPTPLAVKASSYERSSAILPMWR